MILSDSKIKGLKPKESAYYVWHDAGMRGVGRVGVKVLTSGRKTFVYRYYDNGKRKFVTLGDYPSLMLAAAIEKSKTCVEESKTELLATIKQLFDDYITNLKNTGKRSYPTTDNRLKQVLNSPHIDPAMLASNVTPTHIKLVLAEVINRGAIVGSDKIRAALHAAFNFGLQADNDPAKLLNPVIYGLTMNPVSVVPKQQGSGKALDRYLNWDELKELISDCNLSAIASPMHYNFKELILLCIYTCGQRPYELITNTWDNVDFKRKTLTIPPSLSKNKDFNVVPLSDTAIKILKSLPSKKGEGFIFPADTESGHLETSEFAKQVRKYCNVKGMAPFTPRDIRRTFKTLGGEIKISIELRDLIQDHVRPGVSRKHYDRYNYLEEKTEVVKLWEKKVNSLL